MDMELMFTFSSSEMILYVVDEPHAVGAQDLEAGEEGHFVLGGPLGPARGCHGGTSNSGALVPLVRCIFMPSLTVTKPKTSSPGMGVQHLGQFIVHHVHVFANQQNVFVAALGLFDLLFDRLGIGHLRIRTGPYRAMRACSRQIS